VNQIEDPTLINALRHAVDKMRTVGETHQYTAHLLAILLIKYYSAQGNSAASHPSFQDLLELSDTPGNGLRLDNALQLLANSKPQLADALETIKFDSGQLGEMPRRDKTIAELLHTFASIRFDKHQCYEEQIDSFWMDVATVKGRTDGEFYTPPALAELVAKLMSPMIGESIYDPACGTGSLLIQCAKLAKREAPTSTVSLYGQEINANTWALAKMNLELHGERQHDIKQGDTLRAPQFRDSAAQLKLFDVVLSNPPYNVSDWGFESAQHDPFDRFRFGVPPRSKADFAFILHMVASMKPGSGRSAAIIPHGILFRQGAEGKIRRELLAHNLIDAVIGLPPKLLFNTPIHTAILVLRSNKTDRDVLFVDASDGYQAGKIFNALRLEDVESISNAYAHRQTVDGFAKLISDDEIQSRDCSLNISLYMSKPHKERPVDIQAIREEHALLTNELQSLESQFAALRLEIGHA
jgi:type I restriction enzyme M protein